jgi:hypothetical protein
VARFAKKEIIAIFAHVAFIEDFFFAVETFIAFALLYLGLEDYLELVLGFVPAHEAVEGSWRTFEVAFLAWVRGEVQRLRFLQVVQLK